MTKDFVPPISDKVIKRGDREKIPVYLFVDPDEPNVLYIETKEDIDISDNSIYTLSIPSLEFEDGEVKNKFKHEFITAPNPMYVDVEDVLKECRGLPIDKDIIVHAIKEASEIVNYWTYVKNDNTVNDEDQIFDINNIEKDYFPFYMYVKISAVADSVKAFYIKTVSQPFKFKDILSDLERDEEMDLDAIKALLDDLEKDAEEWLQLIVTITADPKWALRGKYSFAITTQNYRPYHPTLIDKTGWSRGY